MKPGVRIPGVRGGNTGAKRWSAGEGAKFHSPAFGEIGDHDRVAWMHRHAELHLSFLAIE